MKDRDSPKEFNWSGGMAIALAEAIADRMGTIDCWAPLSYARSYHSKSVYVNASRIYGERYIDAKHREFVIRISDHEPKDSRPSLCIDIRNGAYADIRLKSRKVSRIGPHHVDRDVWNKTVAEAIETAQRGLANDTRTNPEPAIRKLGGDQAWDRLKKAYSAGRPVEGAILDHTHRGFIVDLGDAVAFLPFVWADVRQFRREELLDEHKNLKQPFKILRLNRNLCILTVARYAVFRPPYHSGVQHLML